MLLLFVYIVIFLMLGLIFLHYKGVINEDFLIKQPKTEKDIKKSICKKLIISVALILSILYFFLKNTLNQEQLIIVVLVSFCFVLFVIADIVNDFIKLNSKISSFVNSMVFRVTLVFILFISFIVSSVVTIPI